MIGAIESAIDAEQRRISLSEGDTDHCLICGDEFDEFLPADDYLDLGLCSKACADAVISECGGKPDEYDIEEALANPIAVALASSNMKGRKKDENTLEED